MNMCKGLSDLVNLKNSPNLQEINTPIWKLLAAYFFFTDLVMRKHLVNPITLTSCFVLCYIVVTYNPASNFNICL